MLAGGGDYWTIFALLTVCLVSAWTNYEVVLLFISLHPSTEWPCLISWCMNLFMANRIKPQCRSEFQASYEKHQGLAGSVGPSQTIWAALFPRPVYLFQKSWLCQFFTTLYEWYTSVYTLLWLSSLFDIFVGFTILMIALKFVYFHSCMVLHSIEFHTLIPFPFRWTRVISRHLQL